MGKGSAPSRRRPRLVGLTLAVATTATMLWGASSAAAATLHVATAANGGADNGACGPVGTPCASVGQAVTNAASNDTIQVGAGTFTGSVQVVIDKKLTLNGAGMDQTTLRPGYDTPADEPWFRVEDGKTLNVNDLTFDGTGNLVFFGIRYFGSSNGAIDSVRFEDIFHSTDQGFGVTTNKRGMPDASSVSLDITNSVFQNIQRVGVLYKGSDVIGTFSGNTYTGKGTGTFLDYALDISAGADVNVVGNTVQDIRGVASDGSDSAGFLVTTFWGPGTTASFSGNNMLNNSTGIVVGFDNTDTSTVTAGFNRIVGNDRGVFTNNPSVVAENNWWGCNGGPGTAGCDTIGADAGASGSVDADPHLVLGATASPATITAGGSSLIAASVATNSNGATPGGNVFPSGVNVAFGTTLGSIPSPVPTSSPTAFSTLTAATAGTATVSALLDNQLVSTPVTVNALPTPTAGGVAGQLAGKKRKCKKIQDKEKRKRCRKKNS